jgi:cysteine synthase
MNLVNHRIWRATDPARLRLARLSDPFPDWLNPFVCEGVVMRAAGVPGDIPHGKWHVSRELLLGAIKDGTVTQKTMIVEASSGNTAQGLAFYCNALDIRARFIMGSDVPVDKVNAVRAIGNNIEVVLHSDPHESTVDRARREGAEEGKHNLDQYANLLNPLAHKKYLGPSIFKAAQEAAIEPDEISIASGTMGTAIGVKESAEELGLPTLISPVVCADRHEVPGARTLQKIENDVRQPWKHHFSLQNIERGTRRESFILAYLAQRWLPQMLGPSFGLGFLGQLIKQHRERLAGTLRKKQVLIFGSDSYLPYANIVLGGLLNEELTKLPREPDILSLIGLSG